MLYHPSALQMLAEERSAELMRRAQQDRQAMWIVRQRPPRAPLWVPAARRVGTWLIALGTRLQAVHQHPICTTHADDVVLYKPS